MLLTTKLFIPPEPGRLVPREGLHARLDEGGGSPLTLVSAPAGFGKTALVSEWIRARSLPDAWVSLDEGDNDPARFWTYLIEALRTVDEGIGTSALRLLQSPQVPPAETLATIVINDAAEPGERMILVLDDLHVITSELLHGGLTFLIENLPPNIRLIATPRSDPPGPWRVSALAAV